MTQVPLTQENPERQSVSALHVDLQLAPSAHLRLPLQECAVPEMHLPAPSHVLCVSASFAHALLHSVEALGKLQAVRNVPSHAPPHVASDVLQAGV